MEKEQVIILQEESGEDLSPNKLKEIAEIKSAEILLKIDESTRKIAEAKENAVSVNEMKAGPFGKTKRKLNAISNAVVMTNEALSQMNNLIQESIHFTCSSVKFAQVMHKTMAHMMVNGFKDANGNIQRLSDDSKEAVNEIIEEAEDFVRKQLEVERKQASLENKLNEKSKVDSEQDMKIESLQTLIADEQSINKRHEQSIKTIIKNIKQKESLDKIQSDEIQMLLRIKKSDAIWKFIALILSSIAIIVSGFVLFLNVVN
ncbi:MAG: hypothetical protein LBQ46_02910 [Treponema sp.]|jgi:hypothetical protein|nr:hypothetical protein [Treponema sp.]